MDHGKGTGRRRRGDDGAAIAEFALMAVLLVFLLFAILQVAALFFVRSVVSSAAADGARLGASVGATPDDGAHRATALIASGLSKSMASNVPCTGVTAIDAPTGLAMTKVHCVGSIRSIFVPLGAFVRIDVTAGSLAERP